MTVTAESVSAAAATIAGAVCNTPCQHARTLSEITGAEIILKFENHQFTGSFKERGALNRLLSLSDSERRAGVVAMSAGNHAQGVAYHARRLGIPATIVMPKATPFIKIEQTRHLGAEIVLEGDDLDASEDHARSLVGSRGLVFIHPYDDEAVIAGQGTVALEMLAAAPMIDTLVVPVGGGGLIAGMAVAAKALKPSIAVIGVETAAFPSMHRAIHDQPPTKGGTTVAEGIAVNRPGRLTFPLVRDHVDEVILVDDGQIERAILMLLEIEKTVVEGAGAIGLAAVLNDPKRFSGKSVGLVLSGGNIDSRLLASLIVRGLARVGRLMRIAVDIPDSPGKLAQVAQIIGDLGGNIVEVFHERAFSALPVKSAALVVVMETRNTDHGRRITDRLAEAGFPNRVLSISAAT
ncbi:MAG: threonine ammonia-lyase [Rhodospirillaceae bacterium]|nr:threonine ammonia-lyase [Rhodospirillaceae bacterium]